MKSLLSIANQKFRSGDLSTARDLYVEFSDANPTLAHLVNSQISIIDSRLARANQKMLLSTINSKFDNVYLVNLEKSHGDRLRAQSHLNKYGVDYQIWDATDGYKGAAYERWLKYKSKSLGALIRYPDMNDREIWRREHYIESAGAIGYIFTYLAIISDAKKNGFRRIFIIEDDVILCDDFEIKFTEFINTISEDWVMLNLGSSQYDWTSVNEEDANSKGWYYPHRLHTTGSFAIALDQSIYDLVIEAAGSFESPFDLLPLGEVYQKFPCKCFVAYPNIVMPDVSSSNIRGGRDQFSHAKKMRWNINEYDYPIGLPILNVLCEDKESVINIVNQRFAISKFAQLRIFVNGFNGVRPVHCNLMDSFDHDLIDKLTDESRLLSDIDLSLMPPADLQYNISSKMLFSIDAVYNDLNDLLVNKSSFRTKATGVVGRVSVIIPTYKRSQGLKSAVISVLEQDYDDIEVIVVDDNGDGDVDSEATDSVLEDLKSYQNNKILRLIKHKYNRNGAAARNTGIYNSTGEYICFLDDDDLYLPGRISDTVERLKYSNKWVGAAYCGFLGWNSPVNNLERYPEGDLTKLILMLDYKSNYIHTNTVTYKRSAVLSLMGFDESFKRHQDIEFNLRFFSQYKIISCKNSGVRLKVNPEGVDNRQVNNDFYVTKSRFISKFKDLISSYDAETAALIYEIHAKEVLRMVDAEGLKDFIRKRSNQDFFFQKIFAS